MKKARMACMAEWIMGTKNIFLIKIKLCIFLNNIVFNENNTNTSIYSIYYTLKSVQEESLNGLHGRMIHKDEKYIK